jgi:hypothetical protein
LQKDDTNLRICGLRNLRICDSGMIPIICWFAICRLQITVFLSNSAYHIYLIHHCFICRLSDLTVSEDAGIEPRTVATLALAVRDLSYNHSARSRTFAVKAKTLPQLFDCVLKNALKKLPEGSVVILGYYFVLRLRQLLLQHVFLPKH